MAPVALVTGAGSGIGLETAKLLAAQGYVLSLAGRRVEALELASDAVEVAGAEDVMTRSTDVGDRDSALGLVQDTLDRFGRVDVLINNAGTAPLVAIGDLTSDEIERSFYVNAIGPAWMINAVWPAMVRQGGGRIVSTSTMGTKDPFPGFLTYAASKAAVNSYARSIAKEGRRHGIYGFAVAPAAVETAMLRALFDESMIPPDRCLAPVDVARVIVECACGERDDENGETIWLSK